MTSRAGLLRWAERYAPLLLAALVAAGTWAAATGALGVRSPLPRVLVLGIALVSGAAVLASRRWPLVAMAAISLLVLAAWPAAVLASWRAGVRLRGRRLAGYLLGAGLVVLAGMAIGAAVGGERRLTMATPANALALFAWLVIFPLVAGLWIQARRDTLAALRDRAERLEREQEARADRARAEERARIAREMHDVVAHRVSLMVVHAGALEVTATEPATIEAAALIRSTGRAALADLREVLGVLRQPPQPTGDPDLASAGMSPPAGLDAVDELVQESRAAGLRVHRHDEGTARPVPGAVARTTYRVVQEGLTNARKHAPDAEVTVHLRHLPDGVEVSVRNGPSTRPGPTLPGAGLGLVGLRERVELVGGRLAAGPGPDGGFLLRALIPMEVGS